MLRPHRRLGLLALVATSALPLALACRGQGSAGGAAEDAARGRGSASVASAKPARGTAEDSLLLPAASVSAFQDPAGLPAYSGPTGSVEGTIFVDGDPSPDLTEDFKKCPAARDHYGKLFREGTPNAGGQRPLADAFVGVTGYSGFYIPSKSEVRKVTIDECWFTERTIDMTIGEHLEVQNLGKGLYAPALAQEPTPAVMVATPMGDPVKLYPMKPAYYTLVEKTGAAPFMLANVYVVAYPTHTVSGADGHYRIDGVPVGKLTVSARLAAIRKTESKEVDVLENVVSHVDLVLTYHKPNPGIPTPAPNDTGRNVNY